MFPYIIVSYNEDALQQQFFLDQRRRERVIFTDTSNKAANHILTRLANTNQSIFFADNEDDARQFLENIAKDNPGKTWMLFTSMATALGKIEQVKVTVDKFDKNGKLPE